MVLTIAVRLLLTPLIWKSQKAQKEMALLQPEIKKIQEQFKNNKEEQAKKMMELYKTYKVNPLSGCLVIALQLPVLFALFGVFSGGLNHESLTYLYSFISNPGTLNPVSFGVLDLSRGNIYLGVIAALSQFLQTKLTATVSPLSSAKNDFSKTLQWQMLYIFPILILFWSYTLPSALTLYWTVLNIFSIVQELASKKPFPRWIQN